MISPKNSLQGISRRFSENSALLTMLSLLFLGLIFSFRPTLFSGFSFIQADPGDTRLNEYILEHSFRWLIGDPLHSSFWNSPFFFPEPNVSAYTETLLGTAPIYWIFRAVGFAFDTSFQLWLITLAILNYSIGYLFLRRPLRFDPLPSALGAFLFAFGSMRICQMGHEQLFPQFWSLLAVWSLLSSIQKPEALKWAFVCLVFQFYASFYLGWFLTFGVYLSLWFCVVHPGFRKPMVQYFHKRWKQVFIWGGLSLLALAPMGYHYFLASQTVGGRPYYVVTAYAPEVISWFYLGKYSWFYRWQEALGPVARLYAPHEQRIGLGLVTFAIVLYELIRERKKKFILLLLSVSACIVILTTKVPPLSEGQLWYYLGYKGFPAANSIRTLCRIAFLLLIPAMIAIASFFQKQKGALAFALMAIFILEQGQSLQYFNKQQNREAIDALAARIPSFCKSFYMVALGGPESNDKTEVDVMWASMQKGIPTLNGYSGNYPPGWNLGVVFIGDVQSWLRRTELPQSDVCMLQAPPPKELVTEIFP